MEVISQNLQSQVRDLIDGYDYLHSISSQIPRSIQNLAGSYSDGLLAHLTPSSFFQSDITDAETKIDYLKNELRSLSKERSVALVSSRLNLNLRKYERMKLNSNDSKYVKNSAASYNKVKESSAPNAPNLDEYIKVPAYFPSSSLSRSFESSTEKTREEPRQPRKPQPVAPPRLRRVGDALMVPSLRPGYLPPELQSLQVSKTVAPPFAEPKRDKKSILPLAHHIVEQCRRAEADARAAQQSVAKSSAAIERSRAEAQARRIEAALARSHRDIHASTAHLLREAVQRLEATIIDNTAGAAGDGGGAGLRHSILVVDAGLPLDASPPIAANTAPDPPAISTLSELLSTYRVLPVSKSMQSRECARTETVEAPHVTKSISAPVGKINQTRVQSSIRDGSPWCDRRVPSIVTSLLTSQREALSSTQSLLRAMLEQSAAREKKAQENLDIELKLKEDALNLQRGTAAAAVEVGAAVAEALRQYSRSSHPPPPEALDKEALVTAVVTGVGEAIRELLPDVNNDSQNKSDIHSSFALQHGLLRTTRLAQQKSLADPTPLSGGSDATAHLWSDSNGQLISRHFSAKSSPTASDIDLAELDSEVKPSLRTRHLRASKVRVAAKLVPRGSDWSDSCGEQEPSEKDLEGRIDAELRRVGATLAAAEYSSQVPRNTTGAHAEGTSLVDSSLLLPPPLTSRHVSSVHTVAALDMLGRITADPDISFDTASSDLLSSHTSHSNSVRLSAVDVIDTAGSVSSSCSSESMGDLLHHQDLEFSKHN